ncbi:MAG: hypothetical protein KF678_01490 [Phycisphaeraceae bacterium]|nr:hypothetical protein [Phycisphaeraceae bacterium]
MSQVFALIRTVLLVGVVVNFGGCFSYSPAHPSRGNNRELARQVLSLPPQDLAPLEVLRARTPDRVFRWAPAPVSEGDRGLSEEGRRLVEQPQYIVTVNEVIEGVLVRMFQHAEGAFELSWLFTGFQPNGRVVTLRHVDAGQWKLAQGRAALRRKSGDWLRPGDGVVMDERFDESGIEAGIEVRVPSTGPPACRGIVLHLWALANNPYEQRVIQAVSESGWLVVDMRPAVRAPPRVTPEDADRIVALEAERLELFKEVPKRADGEPLSPFQKRLEASPAYQRQRAIEREVADLANPSLSVCTTEQVEAAAAQLAARIDEVLADHARAARAVLELTRRALPGVDGLPLVVMGFSAGALSAPTIAAAVGADAVVLIGGASNAVGVALESKLTQGGIRVSCGGKPPTKEVVGALSEAYLRYSRYDAYHTAPLLEGVPVLVVDAGWDTWVPSRFGEQLYQRLGRPERLHMRLGGHGMLFYFLPGQAKWIEQWMMRATSGSLR